jgi:SAM-dependent methyltransferase
MAHPGQTDFFIRLKQRFPQYFQNQKVLEIGSLNINGSIRSHFNNCDYTGIDIGPGPDVDIVANGKDFKSDTLFSVTISTECFEHNPTWAETFENMIRLTTPGGIVIVTAASTGRPEHGTSRTSAWANPHGSGIDYYRNLTTKHFVIEWDFESLFSNYSFEYQTQDYCDLYFYGILK